MHTALLLHVFPQPPQLFLSFFEVHADAVAVDRAPGAGDPAASAVAVEPLAAVVAAGAAVGAVGQIVDARPIAVELMRLVAASGRVRGLDRGDGPRQRSRVRQVCWYAMPVAAGATLLVTSEDLLRRAEEGDEARRSTTRRRRSRSLASRERPGTPNGPRLTHVPSVTGLQSASVEQGLRARQTGTRTW